MVKRTVYIREGKWAYWVVSYKYKLPDGTVHWRWKIVGGQMRYGFGRGGDGTTLVPPKVASFDANKHHFPMLEKFAFDRRKEAEGTLKLLCDSVWEE